VDDRDGQICHPVVRLVAGQQYARQLLLGCETLAAGARLKKGQEEAEERPTVTAGARLSAKV
jgi:hypothetical protein